MLLLGACAPAAHAQRLIDRVGTHVATPDAPRVEPGITVDTRIVWGFGIGAAAGAAFYAWDASRMDDGDYLFPASLLLCTAAGGVAGGIAGWVVTRVLP